VLVDDNDGDGDGDSWDHDEDYDDDDDDNDGRGCVVDHHCRDEDVDDDDDARDFGNIRMGYDIPQVDIPSIPINGIVPLTYPPMS